MPLPALKAVASRLDTCWWYLGGDAFSMTDAFLRRIAPRRWTDERTREYFQRLLREYVDCDLTDSRVGRPGYFTRLGDTVDFSRTTHFAIEGAGPPVPSLEAVDRFAKHFFDPLDGLPPDVVLVARDIDSAYHEYGFRDDEMFDLVAADLRGRGLPYEEVTNWPHSTTANRRAR